MHRVFPHFFSLHAPSHRDSCLPSVDLQAFSHPLSLNEVTAENAGFLGVWTVSFLLISWLTRVSGMRHSIWFGASPQ